MRIYPDAAIVFVVLIRIVDFGTAIALDTDGADTATVPHRAGSMPYMSPEVYQKMPFYSFTFLVLLILFVSFVFVFTISLYLLVPPYQVRS